jgi:hypothetical protein
VYVRVIGSEPLAYTVMSPSPVLVTVTAAVHVP